MCIRTNTDALQVSFAKEPYKRDDTLQKRPIVLRSLRIEATPCQMDISMCIRTYYWIYI